MFDVFLLTVLAATTLFYFFFLTRIHIGFVRLLKKNTLKKFPFISVVIAARNEESNIEQCLHSVLKQHYPPDRFEVIVVDDHSTDRTVSRIQTIRNFYPNVKLLKNLPTNHGKISALTFGIEEANGEIIVTTDADCIVKPLWLLTFATHFSEDTAMVAGPVLSESSETSPIATFDRMEMVGLATVAAGLIGIGRPIICNGANLAYRREKFFQAGGFGNNSVDNDDELLMSRFVRQQLGRIDYAWEPHAVVYTKPVQTFKDFFQQRLRWAAKKGHYTDSTILVELVILYFFFFTLLLSFFFGLFISPTFLLPAGFAFLGKLWLDYLTLRLGARFWEQRISLPLFLLAEIFHVPYIVCVALIAQCTSIRWKGRRTLS